MSRSRRNAVTALLELYLEEVYADWGLKNLSDDMTTLPKEGSHQRAKLDSCLAIYAALPSRKLSGKPEVYVPRLIQFLNFLREEEAKSYYYSTISNRHYETVRAIRSLILSELQQVYEFQQYKDSIKVRIVDNRDNRAERQKAEADLAFLEETKFLQEHFDKTIAPHYAKSEGLKFLDLASYLDYARHNEDHTRGVLLARFQRSINPIVAANNNNAVVAAEASAANQSPETQEALDVIEDLERLVSGLSVEPEQNQATVTEAEMRDAIANAEIRDDSAAALEATRAVDEAFGADEEIATVEDAPNTDAKAVKRTISTSKITSLFSPATPPSSPEVNNASRNLRRSMTGTNE